MVSSDAMTHAPDPPTMTEGNTRANVKHPSGDGRPSHAPPAAGEQADPLDRLTQAVERQTELLGQIAATLFDIASQGESEDEGERETYLDGTPRR